MKGDNMQNENLKIVILDADTLGECDFAPMKAFGEVIHYGISAPSEVLNRCKDADIVLTNKVILDKDIISKLPKLKLICITATGMNNVDVEYATQKGIAVKNVAGYSTSSVAQHTFSIVLSLLSRLEYYDKYCKSGEWAKSPIFTHIDKGLKELENLQWGIIGFGSIGQRVAHIAQAFGANVSYYSTSGKNTQSHFERKELSEILSQSDVISIHAPLNEATKNLLNAQNLPLLKDGAVLVNVGRGGIVNEHDMAEILKSKNIYFGADVLEIEPMRANHPFLDSSIAHKLLITPHVAWAYDKARERLMALTLRNISDYIKHSS